MSSPTLRFTDRVANYVRFRPSYPETLLAGLRERGVLTEATVVADIGSGTGIFTRLLVLPAGRVYAVEPNNAMRTAAETAFDGNPAIVSVRGTAESTTLPEGFVDFITVAQAFHWFAQDRVRPEFARILKPNGRVALIWNERLTDASPFLEEYDRLLRTRATDYCEVNHTRIDPPGIAAFLAPGGFEELRFPYRQTFDLEGLKGRAMSSSYVPGPGHPDHAEFLRDLETLFHRHAVGGRVDFLYSTVLYLGDPGAPGR